MVWQVVFVVYGVLCLYIALTKPTFIWNTSKFKIMQKMFGGDTGLRLFVAAWGIAAILVGVLVFG